MVRKTLFVVGLVGMILTGIAGAALAAPPAMTLSSFEATSTDGVIDGGVRTISVTNINEETLTAHTVDLGQAPCDCVVTTAISGAGALVEGVWMAGDIAPGETVEITFHYGQPSGQQTPAVASVPPPGTPPLTTTLIASGIALMAALAAMWAVRRPMPIPIA